MRLGFGDLSGRAGTDSAAVGHLRTGLALDPSLSI